MYTVNLVTFRLKQNVFNVLIFSNFNQKLKYYVLIVMLILINLFKLYHAHMIIYHMNIIKNMLTQNIKEVKRILKILNLIHN